MSMTSMRRRRDEIRIHCLQILQRLWIVRPEFQRALDPHLAWPHAAAQHLDAAEAVVCGGGVTFGFSPHGPEDRFRSPQALFESILVTEVTKRHRLVLICVASDNLQNRLVRVV